MSYFLTLPATVGKKKTCFNNYTFKKVIKILSAYIGIFGFYFLYLNRIFSRAWFFLGSRIFAVHIGFIGKCRKFQEYQRDNLFSRRRWFEKMVMRTDHTHLTLTVTYIPQTSVGYPWHFGADPDPYLWLISRIQRRIRLLSSVTTGTLSSVVKNQILC